jgi:predicted signal transduction protein with EAL and GGDEF domain
MSGFDTRTLEAAKRIGQERGLNINRVISKPIRVQELKEVLTALKQPETQPIDKTDITRGLARDEFFLLYQPKVTIKTGALSGTEALLYWKHPTHGVLPPDLFISLAEETRLIDDLADFVLVNAIHQQKIWMEKITLASG